MLGAIIGDISGSRFEFDNICTKEFDFLDFTCHYTDDTLMTIAIAKAILECKDDYSQLGNQAVKWMRKIGRENPNSYGSMFREWLLSDEPEPYFSFGNGAAMRVSPCGFAAKSLEQAIAFSKAVTEVTHNHPEGLKGAEATAVAVYLARRGKNKRKIRKYITKHYYDLNFTVDEVRDGKTFDETCQGTVPQAIVAFLESTSYEDAIRNAISIGGDSDTIAAITGGMAEAYYGIPDEIKAEALTFLPAPLIEILKEFQTKFKCG